MVAFKVLFGIVSEKVALNWDKTNAKAGGIAQKCGKKIKTLHIQST